MKNLFRNILFFAAAHVMAVSCLSSTLNDDRQATVRFRPVLENSVRSAGDGLFPDTVDFGVWGITEKGKNHIERERVSFNGKEWETQRQHFWPDGSGLAFAAFAPYGTGFTFDGERLKLEDFDLSECNRQLYVSEIGNTFYGRDSIVHLRFAPVTSRLDFRIANGLAYGTEIIIEKIILEGVYVKGTYSSSSILKWKTLGEKCDITVYDRTSMADSPEKDRILGRTQEYYGRTLDVIPQNSFPRIKVIYSFSSNGSGWITGQSDCTENLSSGWLSGRRYTYSLTITGSSILHTTGISYWSEPRF